MALNGENGSDIVMPVGPIYGGGGYSNNVGYSIPMMPAYYGGYGDGGFGGEWSWIIVLFLFAAMGGGFGGFGGGFGDGAFPWLMSGQAGINANTNAGFDNAGLSAQLCGIQSSISSGFAGAEVADCNRAMDAMQTAYTNQIASMNQSFAQSQALDNRLFDMEMAQQNCCCENRLGLANLTSTVIQENCADREALSNGIRDIITAQTAGTQRILDQLCQDKIDEKNERIVELQNQVNMQNLAASQGAQTAQLIADNNAQTAQLIQRIAPYPVPAYQVGNPYGYYYNNGFNGCGCGCGATGFNGTF